MFADSPTDVPSKVRIGTRKLKGKYYIAEGGFSHVFAVKDTKTKEYFALKRMTCKDEKQLAHAIEEVAVMKRIPAHPHIIDLEGIEISHSEKAERKGVSTVDILMKIMKGGRLIDVMKARTKHFLMEEMLHIFTCVCSGVQHLHNLHIAHRDLKIENVLLDSDSGAETWKICDFGSCTTTSYECTTEDHVLLARENIELNTTPTYRSPEMVNVQIGCIVGDVSGDIWALGCMLYKMAYFRDAFEAGGPAICKAEYTCPEEPPLPAAFQHVLGLCLQLAPGARPVIETLVEHVEMLKSCNSVEMLNSCSEMNLKNNVLHSKQQPHSNKPSSRPRTPPTARRPNMPAPLTTQGLPPAKVPDRISPSTAPQSAPSQPATLLISSPAVSVAAPAEQGSRSRAESASTHRRTESLPVAQPVLARPRSISKSADSGGAYSMEHVAQPGHASSSSDGAVLQETQQRLMSEEADRIHEQLKEIETQEASLKLKRRTLEGRLVQIYEQQPSLVGPARLVSRGLTAPVSVASTNETPQVDVACFFAGSHDGGSPKNKTSAAGPKSRRSNSLSSAEDFYSGNHQGVDHGPRTPVSHESSTKWPDVVLTLESFESSSTEQSIESSGLAQPQHMSVTTSRSTTLVQQQQQQPSLFHAHSFSQAQPIINTAQPTAQANAAAKMQRSHRRSASMSVGGMSIRPLHQQSSAQRKSPQAVMEEGNRISGKPFSLQPPPPPRQSRNDVSTTM